MHVSRARLRMRAVWQDECERTCADVTTRLCEMSLAFVYGPNTARLIACDDGIVDVFADRCMQIW